MSMTRRDWHDDREDGIDWAKRDLEARIAADARPCGAAYEEVVAASYRAQEETRQREAREQAARIADGEFFEVNALIPGARDQMHRELIQRHGARHTAAPAGRAGAEHPLGTPAPARVTGERNADRARREHDEREAKREDERLARGEQARTKGDR